MSSQISNIDIEDVIKINIDTFTRIADTALEIVNSDNYVTNHDNAVQIQMLAEASAEMLKRVHDYHYTLMRQRMQNALDNFKFDNED